MKHEAIYARTSREFKNIEKVSIAQQVDDCQKAAKTRIPPERIYIDADLSGKMPPSQLSDGATKTRPSLSRLLEAVSRGEVDSIIVRKRDRLFRSTLLALRFYEFLTKHHCALKCTHETLPAGNDASGRFTLTVLSAAAQLELEKTSENIKAAKAYSRREGRKMGPCWTPGFKDFTRGKVEINLPVAEMVREVFSRASSGVPVQSITRWLNTQHRDKCRPHKDKNPVWHPTSVWRMLSNRRYIGLDDNGNTSKLYSPIVSPGVYWTVQEILKARRGTLNGSKRQKHERPLAGLLICGYCGKSLHTVSMSVKTPERKLYACARCEIPHKARPFVMRESRWLQFLKDLFITGTTEPRESDETALLKSQLETIDERVKQLAAEWANGKISVSAYSAATTAVEGERARISRRLANTQPAPAIARKVNPFLPQPGSWESLTPIEQKVWLHRCVEKVVVFQDHAIVHPIGERSVQCPRMREAIPGQRAANCLCPKYWNTATRMTIQAGIYNTARIDWNKFITKDFYPHSQSESRLVSRRARRRHGLKDGKNYPGKKPSP